MPTASVPGRNDVDLEPQMLDVEKYIARAEPLLAARFLRNGNRAAHRTVWPNRSRLEHVQNRVTIQAIPSRSCAASTAFSFSMTANAGGSCPFTGSTRARSTRFRRNISSRDLRLRCRRFESVRGRDCRFIETLRRQCRVRAPNAFTSFANLSSIPGAGCGAYRSRMYVSAICRMRLDSLGSD